MADEESFVDGLVKDSARAAAFRRRRGAAVLFDGQCPPGRPRPTSPTSSGSPTGCPSGPARTSAAPTRWRATFPEAESYEDRASGLLAISISKLHRSYVLWFRPEVVRTVKWGGDPRKPIEPENGHDGRLHPRRASRRGRRRSGSGRSPGGRASSTRPRELRNAIVGIVLRKAEELAQLSAELKRSNQELEAFSYSVSHDLRAPFRHIVGYCRAAPERGRPG